MPFQSFKVSSHHLPSVGLHTRLFVELAVEGGLVIQFFNLLQQGVAVTIWIPEEDGIVVEDVGLGVIV